MQQREKVVPMAHGVVLEVSIGSGLNLSFYNPDRITKALGLDPSPEITRIADKGCITIVSSIIQVLVLYQ